MNYFYMQTTWVNPRNSVEQNKLDTHECIWFILQTPQKKRKFIH